MRKGKYQHTRPWLKLYSDKWLGGSIRVDMDSAQRGVWADLMCWGNVSPVPGIICASKGLPFPHEYIAARLRIPLELLESTLAIRKADGSISEDGKGIHITNWTFYQAPPGKVDKEGKADKEPEPTFQLTPEQLEKEAEQDSTNLAEMRDYVKRCTDEAVIQEYHDRIAAAEKWIAAHPKQE